MKFTEKICEVQSDGDLKHSERKGATLMKSADEVEGTEFSQHDGVVAET